VSTWLNALRNRSTQEPAGLIMELLVLAGEDAGNQFTLEGDRVLVGRGQPESGQTDVVRLDDKSISHRQAWITREAEGTSIEHITSAANPTLVNGLEIQRSRLSVGDRIEMGRIVIDVRARGGLNLRGLTEIMEDVARESTMTGAARDEAAESRAEETTARSEPLAILTPLEGVAREVTDIRPMEVQIGGLKIVRGVASGAYQSFPIFMGTTRLGRGEDVEIQISELGVSRLHAEITVDGRSILLSPKSQTNPTLLNGFPLHGSVELSDGDEIRLADQVVLEVSLRIAGRSRDGLSELSPDSSSAASSAASSALSRRMEHKIDLDREIEEYNVMGSFVDVDVVASRAMKGGGEKAEHIIVSFQRFRAYVGGICEEWEGQVLNSNGDELMCFFESATNAILAGSAILERLEAFNRDLNLLGKDFQFRLGAHTGVSLVDLDAGLAYSEVLDTAGHIQKFAEPNTLVVSQKTLDSLPGSIPVTAVGEITGEAGQLYRIDRALRPADFED
jgi:pSer/pThr/pTyr-binding forkhead associated (FHA) protein